LVVVIRDSARVSHAEMVRISRSAPRDRCHELTVSLDKPITVEELEPFGCSIVLTTLSSVMRAAALFGRGSSRSTATGAGKYLVAVERNRGRIAPGRESSPLARGVARAIMTRRCVAAQLLTSKARCTDTTSGFPLRCELWLRRATAVVVQVTGKVIFNHLRLSDNLSPLARANTSTARWFLCQAGCASSQVPSSGHCCSRSTFFHGVLLLMNALRSCPVRQVATRPDPVSVSRPFIAGRAQEVSCE
jgi:hypothetical protein